MKKLLVLALVVVLMSSIALADVSVAVKGQTGCCRKNSSAAYL